MRRVESGEGLRLEGARCACELRRLGPSVLLIVITGDDAGELGAAPHAEVDREIERYGPVDLRVDARGTTGVGPAVAQSWTEFIRARGERVRQVTLLVASRQVALAAQSAGALSGVGRTLAVTSDAARFDAEVAALAGAGPGPAAAAVEHDTRADGTVALGAGGFRVTVSRRGAGAVDVTMAGFDGGRLCAPLFDEIARQLAAAGHWTIFLDAGACTGVAGRSADAWGAWIRAHLSRLRGLHVLATSAAVRLALGLEGEIAGIRPVLRVYTDPSEFSRAREAAGR